MSTFSWCQRTCWAPTPERPDSRCQTLDRTTFFLFIFLLIFFLFRAVCIQTQHHVVYIIECQILIIINFSRSPPPRWPHDVNREQKNTHTISPLSPVSSWRVYQNIIHLVPIFWRAFLLLKKKGRKGAPFFSRSCSIAPRRSIDDCVNIWPTPSFKETQQQLFSPPSLFFFFFRLLRDPPDFLLLWFFEIAYEKKVQISRVFCLLDNIANDTNNTPNLIKKNKHTNIRHMP
jgi:hypothetical protein